MIVESVKKRAAATWDAVNDPEKSGEEREAIIRAALIDQISVCYEVARRRYEEAEMNRREYDGCGRTVADHYAAKMDAAAKIMQDLEAIASPYKLKKNPNIG